MSTQRPLSPFEITYFGEDTRLGSVPVGGMPLFIGSTVRGEIDPAALREVLAELAAAHPLLRARVVTGHDGVPRFELDDSYAPNVQVIPGGADAYRTLVNTRQDWRAGLFRAQVLRDRDETQVVLILHHGIADGRSVFPLLDEMWRRYTARVSGSPLPPPECGYDLPDGVDTQLARLIDDTEVDAFVEMVRAGALAMDPAAAPVHLPRDGHSGGDRSGRLAMRRIALTAEQTGALVTSARAQGFSMNSLLAGAALAAVRTEFVPGAGLLPMMCGHAVDLRPDLVPALTESTVLNCAAGAGTPVLVDADSHPVEIAVAVAAGMHASAQARFPAMFMRAAQRELDPVTTALFTAPPTLALSNIGRVPAHSLPAGVEFIRDDIFAMAPGMPPKMTLFTVGGRLTIQVEYDTAEHSHVQMERIAAAMTERLRRIDMGAAAHA
ncbi:hypothetical protein OHB26_31290 [Nocardia sp. NBC_01503]|uniref:phthiocerol/phthiodiolone dimycocerosyl transferase family protein n=1 Tax=Nocardia sp. NBC_01503 TaxID=2975997 RepID=UPI002E7BF5F9|nr:hypothetical protein [Nocardia sp. NBC_01503]WTL31360.1 hypothetical protein OHB26_31290 [Nocardia sp. NBC_01503]